MHFLIIGGSDAGISAGLRAHELDPTPEITLVLADSYPNYSICGLPFFPSGETPDWHSLAHRTEFPGIHLLPNHTAENIDPIHKAVLVRRVDGQHRELRYDTLLIGTGACPVRPDIEGIDLPGVFALHTMEDSFAIRSFLELKQPKSAIIVGAGYIGLEMADALTRRGIQVTVASRTKAVLASVDSLFGKLIPIPTIGLARWQQMLSSSFGTKMITVSRPQPGPKGVLSTNSRLPRESIAKLGLACCLI